MAWKTLDEAAATGPSHATWERRIESDRVPHYLDPSSGRRLVWVTSESGDDLREVLEQVAGLRELVMVLKAEVAGLRSGRAKTARRRVRRPRPAAPKPTPTPVSPRATAPSEPRRGPEPVVSEAEIARLMTLRATSPLGDKALQRAAGLASNWFWKVKRGHCRSALAVDGWQRLEAFLTPREVRQAA